MLGINKRKNITTSGTRNDTEYSACMLWTRIERCQTNAHDGIVMVFDRNSCLTWALACIPPPAPKPPNGMPAPSNCWRRSRNEDLTEPLDDALGDVGADAKPRKYKHVTKLGYQKWQQRQFKFIQQRPLPLRDSNLRLSRNSNKTNRKNLCPFRLNA